MTDRVPPDPPTRRDIVRLRAARRAARAAVAAAECRCLESTEAAFRRELIASVRSASPFLVALAAIEGMTLDDVAARLERPHDWPKRRRPSEAMPEGHACPHPLRHGFVTGVARRGGQLEGAPACRFRIGSGGWAEVRVIAHSLEVTLTLGSLEFRTRFGELVVHVRGGLPGLLTACAVGRPLDDFVLHPATRGRGWCVDAVDGASAPTSLICRTGSVPCRLG